MELKHRTKSERPTLALLEKILQEHNVEYKNDYVKTGRTMIRTDISFTRKEYITKISLDLFHFIYNNYLILGMKEKDQRISVSRLPEKCGSTYWEGNIND